MGLFHSIGHFFHKIGHGISHVWHEIKKHPTLGFLGLSMLPGVGTIEGLLGLGPSVLSGVESIGSGLTGALGLGGTSLTAMGSMADTALGAMAATGGGSSLLSGLGGVLGSLGLGGLTGGRGGTLGSLASLANVGYDLYAMAHRPHMPSMPSIDFQKMPKLELNIQKPQTKPAPTIQPPQKETSNAVALGMRYGYHRKRFELPQVQTQMPEDVPRVNRPAVMRNIKRDIYNKTTNRNFDLGGGFGFNVGYGGSYTDVTHPVTSGQAKLYAPPGMIPIVTTHYQKEGKAKSITVLSGFKDASGHVYKIPVEHRMIVAVDGQPKSSIRNMDTLKHVWESAGLGALAADNVISNTGVVKASGLSNYVASGTANKPMTMADISAMNKAMSVTADSSGVNEEQDKDLVSQMLKTVLPQVTTSVVSRYKSALAASRPRRKLDSAIIDRSSIFDRLALLGKR